MSDPRSPCPGGSTSDLDLARFIVFQNQTAESLSFSCKAKARFRMFSSKRIV